MPMPENLSEAAQRERTRRMLNQKDFELNMGPDGAQLMRGRLDTNGNGGGGGRGSGDWTCAMPDHLALRLSLIHI